MAVKISQKKCKGCKLCLDVCPFDAIYMINGVAKIDEKCTACGACIEVCKFGAIKKEKIISSKKDLTDYEDVWIFAEQRQGEIMPVVIELLGEGKKLANEIGSDLCAILLGEKVNDLAEELIDYGADKVYIADNKLIKNYTTDGYAKVISDAANEIKPEIILMGATHIGRDLAPRISARLDTGLTADCTKLEIDSEDKKLQQTRPAFGGNIMATIVCPDHRPQMATVRPGVMNKAVKSKNNSGDKIKLKVKLNKEDIRTEIIEKIKTTNNTVSIEDAEVIVSGGKGLGKSEGFKLLKKLANKFDGTLGASRATVDEGWIEKSHQVGQTGTTVKPRIYIACGISGAIQHLAGMKNSDIIIAINTDKNAPIFQVSDYGIVGDLYDVIPQLMDALDNVDELVDSLENKAKK